MTGSGGGHVVGAPLQSGQPISFLPRHSQQGQPFWKRFSTLSSPAGAGARAGVRRCRERAHHPHGPPNGVAARLQRGTTSAHAQTSEHARAPCPSTGLNHHLGPSSRTIPLVHLALKQLRVHLQVCDACARVARAVRVSVAQQRALQASDFPRGTPATAPQQQDAHRRPAPQTSDATRAGPPPALR